MIRSAFRLAFTAFVLTAVATGCSESGENIDPTSDTSQTDVGVPSSPNEPPGPTGPDAIANPTPEPVGEGDVTEPSADVPPEPDTSCTCTTNADCEGAVGALGACQIALCDAVTCECVVGDKKDYAACDDELPCTSESYCLAGECAGGVAVNCDDGNPCTADSCADDGSCTNEPNTDPCDDNDSCTLDDVCAEGSCGGTADAANPECACVEDADCTPSSDLCVGNTACVDGVCTLDSSSAVTCDTSGDTACLVTACVPATGACEQSPVTDGSPCNDDNACTTGDACSAGVCAGGDNQCECTVDADCGDFNDSNLCNGTLSCVENQCVVDPATVVTCPQSESADCTIAQCQPSTGLCEDVPAADGTACGDGSLCTTQGTCQAGTCSAGAALSCDDGEECTADSCDPSQGCTFTPTEGDCDDGDACTVGEACDAETGTCGGGEALGCDDGEPCTDDSCAPETGCEYSDNNAECDDGDPCTVGDGCLDGACAPGAALLNCNDDNICTQDTCETGTGCANTPFSCDDGDACTTDSCDPVDGCIHTPLPTESCDDDNVCTEDSCDPAVGCVQVPLSESDAPFPCEDGNACTSGDTCLEGACLGGPLADCDDANPCTTDSCDPQTGCESTNNGAPCDDGDLCTSGESCSEGSCQGGAPVDCDDGDPCTDDSCDALAGCTTAFNTAPCDDGLVCSTGDICSEGVCTADTSACACADDSECADDGNLCNGAPSCVDGTCTAGAAVACPANNSACVISSCEPATGECVASNLADGTPCDDGDLCTTSSCLAGVCDGDPIDCGGNTQPCASVGCDPSSGECVVTPADGESCDDGNECTAGSVCQDFACGGGEDTCPVDYCCAGKATPGCPNNPDVEACVCELDSFCCDSAWDELCGESAGSECGLACGGDSADCCTAHNGVGCQDSDVENCVCELDPYCCDTQWDALCVDLAQESCELTCELGGPCCTASEEAGCIDPSCEECVCIDDPFCCETQWDTACVESAASDCFSQCNCAAPPSGGCCEAGLDTGCADTACEECVCALDPFCCEVQWDVNCAASAAADCPAACGCDPASNDCCSAHEGTACADEPCAECVCALDPLCCSAQWDEECVLAAESDPCASSCPCVDSGDGDCCSDNSTPGCDDENCQSCVCGLDSFCCETSWDQLCYNCALGIACGDPQDEALGCADACGCPIPIGGCCEIGLGPGCEDETCAACVCATDEACCSTLWDETCVLNASQDCNDICLCIPPGDCCEVGEGSGCTDAACESCVCEQDAFCCDLQWDAACVACAAGDGCGDDGEGDCSGVCDCAGQCCLEGDSPGCPSDPPCEACVCELDSFCCDTLWDGVCADEAADECADSCSCATAELSACCQDNTQNAEAAGCGDAACEECVCGENPLCCDVAWDASCAEVASSWSCYQACPCVEGPLPSPCCQALGDPGCPQDPICSECVCAIDAVCCDFGWDEICAQEAVEDCNDACNCAPGLKSCCEASPTQAPGCPIDSECEGCVCEADEFCCETVWDETCVALAGDPEGCNLLCECQEPPAPPSCCEATLDAGCAGNDACADCVCSTDPFCCQSSWDDVCVEAAQAESCAELCGCTDEPPAPVGSDCCVDNQTPGCDNPECEACVCGADAFCCDTAWDAVCKGAAEAECVDACGCASELCCEALEAPGCAEDPACEACVCGADSFCCETSWDALCVDCAAGVGCGSPPDAAISCQDACGCEPVEPELTTCVDFLNCFDQCTTQECADACFDAEDIESANIAITYLDCVLGNCGEQPTQEEFNACVQATCPTELDACINDV